MHHGPFGLNDLDFRGSALNWWLSARCGDRGGRPGLRCIVTRPLTAALIGISGWEPRPAGPPVEFAQAPLDFAVGQRFSECHRASTSVAGMSGDAGDDLAEFHADCRMRPAAHLVTQRHEFAPHPRGTRLVHEACRADHDARNAFGVGKPQLRLDDTQQEADTPAALAGAAWTLGRSSGECVVRQPHS